MAHEHGHDEFARCPVHDDRNPSLSLSDSDDGRLLLCCHAGCPFSEIIRILQAKGLKR
ncbi:hypothetical protein V3564_00890 [Bartonella sp. B12(2025)]